MPPLDQPRQWRSLAELEGDPAFLARARQEFPMLREALEAPRKRRQVLRLVAAALAAGSLGGCYSGETSGHLIPQVRNPPDIVPGLPNHYATAHVLGGYALGTVVTHQNGRPIKVEGNPNHPSSLGATDPFSQAEVLGFYDPDRAAGMTHQGAPVARQTLLGAIVGVHARIQDSRGAGLRILTGATSSPTLVRLMNQVLHTYPEAQWHVWEPANRDNVFRGATLAYGAPVEIVPRLDKADVVLGLDSDLLGYAPGWVRNARDFASRRNPTRTQAMSRVYAAEPSPTLLGSVADHRFIAGPQQMHAAIAGLAKSVIGGGAPDGAPSWVGPVADDLKSHQGAAFIHAGPNLSPEIHALVMAMNEALGGRGRTFEIIDAVTEQPQGGYLASLTQLVEDMRAGRVTTLIILDCNPAFTAPGSLGFADALARVQTSFAFTKWPDETAQIATWSAPLVHEWETWGDARAHDGTATIMQPMALPLYDGLSAPEILTRLLGQVPPSDREIVQATWHDELGGSAERWRDALAKGIIAGTAAKPSAAKLQDKARPIEAPAPAPAKLTLLLRPDPRIWDGRYANNPWLQELPAPLSKLTWDNPLFVSPELAREAGLANGTRVNLRTGDGAISIPVWILPGQAKDVVLAWFGNGRRATGAVGRDVGWDVYPLTGGAGAAEIQPTGEIWPLASTDHHGLLFSDISGIVKHADLETFHKHPEFAKTPPKPELYRRKPPGPAAWAMSVDLNACIGCNACVIACQAENNVPSVGKEQVLMEREMQWLRIDRYYEGSPEEPETYFQPMLCMHCEEAPCEVVCPPGATVHDAEGLNLMVYNRCIGTRFCSNNCPYKVRRFNFYPYAHDQNRPPTSWNNNVTVRAGGVMEKCTYCVQRIWSARIIADQLGVADGTIEVKTACQSACPTQAFTFGDQNNTKSEVHQRKQSPLDYGLLEDLHTHPRTTYEALVRNPNPALRKTGA